MYIHFLELKKVTNEEKNDKLKKWLFFLKKEGTGDKTLSEIIENDSDINKAHKRYVKFTHDEMLRDLHEARIKWKRDHATLLQTGLAEAREEGVLEARLELAARLLDEGLSVKKIAELTGLSESEVGQIKP